MAILTINAIFLYTEIGEYILQKCMSEMKQGILDSRNTSPNNHKIYNWQLKVLNSDFLKI